MTACLICELVNFPGQNCLQYHYKTVMHISYQAPVSLPSSFCLECDSTHLYVRPSASASYYRDGSKNSSMGSKYHLLDKEK